MTDVRELTPSGRGAVSVISVRGRGALERVRTLVARSAGALRLEPARPQLVRLVALGETLDEALVCVEGDEAVELHVHGSPPLVRRVLRELGAAGDGAQPPLDALPLEAAAERLLAASTDEDAARTLLDQAEGALRRALQELVALPPAGRARAAAVLVRAGHVGRRLFEPASVVLAGPVNAGKSTLFNALYGARRVLESEARGTTRDWIRERARIGRYPVWLSDTAGERDPREAAGAAHAEDAGQAALERAGQELAREARARADLVLWLEPLHAPDPSALAARIPFGPAHVSEAGVAGRARIVRLATQADRAPRGARAREPFALAARDEPEAARALVAAVFERALDLPREPWRAGQPVPFQAAQIALLERLVAGIDAGAAAAELAALLERR